MKPLTFCRWTFEPLGRTEVTRIEFLWKFIGFMLFNKKETVWTHGWIFFPDIFIALSSFELLLKKKKTKLFFIFSLFVWLVMRKQLNLYEFISMWDLTPFWLNSTMDWSCVVYGNVLEFQLHVWLKNWNRLYVWTQFHGRCIACLISGLWMKALPVILYFMPFETIAELRGYCPSHGRILCSYESLRLKHCLTMFMNVALIFNLGWWLTL